MRRRHGLNRHSLLLKQGAELEMKDIQGWTALFHCTSAGHQQMVKFLLDSGANANVRSLPGRQWPWESGGHG